MKPTAILLPLTLAFGVAFGVVGNNQVSAQQQAIKRTTLQKIDLTGMEGKELNMWITEIAPGAATGKHYHPGHEAVYVLEGSYMLEIEGKPPVTVKAGESVHNAPKLVHDAKNNTTAPVKLLVVLVGEKGQPLTVPVQ